MTRREVSDEEVLGKIALFVSSAIIGGSCGTALHNYFGLALIAAIVWGTATAILIPVLARIVVAICELLHKGSFPDTYHVWSVEKKVWMGVFWPITLPFWVIIFIFFVSINHVFR